MNIGIIRIILFIYLLLAVYSQGIESNDSHLSNRDLVDEVIDEDISGVVDRKEVDEASVPEEAPKQELGQKADPEHKTEPGFFMPKTALKDPHTNGAGKPATVRENAAKVKAEPKLAQDGTKKQPPTRKVNEEKSKRMGGSTSNTENLERKLSHELGKNRRDTVRATAESRARAARFQIPRKYAYPVEHIIEVYNDPNTDLYDVLGVKDTISDEDLRKAHRAAALVLHPDKNPHPDAKQAFDCLVDAYKAIASPSLRQAYDQERHRSLAVRRNRRWNPRRWRKALSDHWSNWRSDLQLLHHELAHTETAAGLRRNSAGKYLNLLWQRIRDAMQRKASAMKGLMQQQVEHYVRLPSVQDRVQLLHEQLWRYKLKTLVTLLLVALLWK